ncbi:MAG: hypothetical protein FWG36_10720 [Oscillospiraceae bacterium]|nr:hypothetical protein [Oscillospiraceae bacterium]
MLTAKIKRFCVDDASCDERGMGMTLIVDLDNGSSILLTLDSKADDPLFRDVVKGICGKPQTDGERVYWENGASLTIQNMIEILQVEKNEK